MAELWMRMAGMVIGMAVLIIGIVVDRDFDQSEGEAVTEGSRRGEWFMEVFGNQAVVIGGMQALPARGLVHIVCSVQTCSIKV